MTELEHSAATSSDDQEVESAFKQAETQWVETLEWLKDK